MDFSRFRLLSFDCYGTLIDWETGIWDALQRLFLANDGKAPVSRAQALAAYAEEESRIERANPGLRYDAVLAEAHRALAKRWGLITTPGLDEAFAASIGCWPAFADTAESLRRLKARFRLMVLSNVHRHGLEQTAPKLGVEPDAALTAEHTGVYKPDPESFRRLIAHAEQAFGVQPDEILHVAQSLYHDIAPAKELGLACAWIDRQRLSDGGHWGATPKVEALPQPDVHYYTLAELADDVCGLAHEG